MNNKDFLGVGMKFPPQVNPATGRIVTAGLESSVKESIYIILMTRNSERIPRPEFGANLDRYVFMDVNTTALNMMRTEISRIITTQEPRISDVSIDVEPQMGLGRLIVNIEYTIIATNTRENFVFPYYLDNGFGEEENTGMDEEILDFDQEEYDDEESEDDFD